MDPVSTFMRFTALSVVKKSIVVNLPTPFSADIHMVLGKLSLEVIHMESTYSDRYANLMEDPAMEAYFVQLPGYIQAQIRARKHQPATLEDLKRMAEEVKQLF